jgi:DNA ligase-4
MTEVDELLDELASTSIYSDPSLCKKYPLPHRKRTDILKTLFRRLPPHEAAFMTHIILKDLRPILYPSPETNYSMSLLDYNTKAIKMLSVQHAMTVWDPSRYMSNLCRVKASVDETTAAFELPEHVRSSFKPNIGSMIQVGSITSLNIVCPIIFAHWHTCAKLPESVKGTGCRNALSHFQRSATVWAETKYDGERAQIHVEVLEDGSPRIKIFSKSKRDSTWDRFGLHGIIFEALGFDSHQTSRFSKNIVLDAELVAWCNDQIDGACHV